MPEMPTSGSCRTTSSLTPRRSRLLLTGRLVEQPRQHHGLLVVDGGNHVGVAHVVDPGHVLVADALDAVLAKAQRVERRALQRLVGDHPQRRVPGAQVVAGGDRPGRPGGARVGGQPAVVGPVVVLVDLLDDRAGHLVVPDRVAELLELVEDHDPVAALAAQLPALVVDLLDVGLGAGGGDDLVGADLAQPVEALLAHALGQDRHRRAGQQGAVVGAAAAVVAGRRPDRLLACRVVVARDQPRHQATVGRADLVRAGREPVAQDTDDLGVDPGQLRRKLDPVALAKAAAPLDPLVVPGDAEQVGRVDVPQAQLGQAADDGGRDLARVLLLGERRQDDVALAGQADGPSRGPLR